MAQAIVNIPVVAVLSGVEHCAAVEHCAVLIVKTD